MFLRIHREFFRTLAASADVALAIARLSPVYAHALAQHALTQGTRHWDVLVRASAARLLAALLAEHPSQRSAELAAVHAACARVFLERAVSADKALRHGALLCAPLPSPYALSPHSLAR